MSEGWTEEKVARLTAMVAERASASMIAEAFGDVSRAAVIGKCHRLGLTLALPQGGEGMRQGLEARGISRLQAPRKVLAEGRTFARSKPQPVATRQPATSMDRPAPQPVFIEPEIDPTPKRWPKPAGPEAITQEQLKAEHCRMPLWADDAKSGLFCGKPVRAEGQSWCAACAKLVFERRPIRERELREMQQARMAKQGRSGAFA